MINVYVLYEHSGDFIPHGSSYIRLLYPLSYCSNNINMVKGIDYKNIDANAIIWDRQWMPNLKLYDVENFLKYIRKKRIKFIYSLDDNLLDLNLFDGIKQKPTYEEKNIIRMLIKEADGVIVSTKQLKERLNKLNSNIFVIENALHEDLIRSEKEDKIGKTINQIVIGYMGTPTHDQDFLMILPAIKNIMEKYKDIVRFEIVGVLSDDSIIKSIRNAKKIDVKNNYEYPKYWSWMKKNIFWDIAIAPLEKNLFNNCKSDIKFLDYSALGIAGVYSNVEAYKHTIINGETGLLVDNNIDDWFEAIEKLINDNNYRISIANKSKQYLINNRTLKKCAYKWENALIDIINKL
jgi:glycosyltransferase involved in cell wall biosynthesis